MRISCYLLQQIGGESSWYRERQYDETILEDPNLDGLDPFIQYNTQYTPMPALELSDVTCFNLANPA